MDDTKLDDWFTKTQAAGFLKVSEKTVERLATKGTVRRATRKRPGVRPSPVYCPDDLERVKAAQTAQMIVMPPRRPTPVSLLYPLPAPESFQYFCNRSSPPRLCR